MAEPIPFDNAWLDSAEIVRRRRGNLLSSEQPLPDSTELAVFLRCIGVRIPYHKVCDSHQSPWEAFCASYFAKEPVVVWKASRGFGGKTFQLGALSLAEAITQPASVTLLGGSGEQSRRVYTYLDNWWRHPAGLKSYCDGDPTALNTRLKFGNTITALMASTTSVRGAHPQRLRLDEVDEMKLQIFDASMGQTMRKAGVETNTTISSTYHNPRGTMKEVLDRAKQRGWPVFSWCWRETCNPLSGWLAEDEVERKQTEVTHGMWNVEYDMDEPTAEGRAFDPAAVEAMFDGSLGTVEGGHGRYAEFEEPEQEAQYATGADWARTIDWTIIVTIRTDVFPKRVVAFERLGRMPWPYMIGRLDDRLDRYSGPCLHDRTGIGDVIDQYLTNEDIKGLVLGGETRRSLLTNYTLAVERGRIASPMVEYMHGEHKYATWDDLYGSGKDAHLPDTVCAMALAWAAKDQEWGRYKII